MAMPELDFDKLPIVRLKVVPSGQHSGYQRIKRDSIVGVEEYSDDSPAALVGCYLVQFVETPFRFTSGVHGGRSEETEITRFDNS